MALSLKSVCELPPLLLIVAVPAFDVLKKLTSAAGKAPEPLLLIVDAPAVELSRKLMIPVAWVLFRMAVPAVAVSKNSIRLPEPLLLIVEAPAVLVPL